jgi:hypothetical protein
MGKVSIGLRGWRFEEDEVFTESGEFRPLEEIPKEPRHRLVRLEQLLGRPCDVCYLVHGEEDKQRCREAAIVYGDPFEEVVLCDQHEGEFLYWFREAGGRELAGEDGFADAFHEWFADGNRAPEGYAGLDHVDTDPENLPDPPDAKEVQRRLEEEAGVHKRQITPDGVRVVDGDADEEGGDGASDDGEEGPGDLSDLDLGREYPS